MSNLNHNIFNRRYVVIQILVIAVIVLLWLVFRGGVNAPSHKQAQKEIKQQQQDVRTADKEYSMDSVRWKRAADSLALELADAHEQLDIYQKELSVGRKKVQVITTNIQQAKDRQDTAAIVRHCDSLQLQVEQQAGVIIHYEKLADTTFLLYEQRLAAKDSIISNQAELLSRFRSANLNLETKYNELSVDYNRVVRKAKQGRTMNRILAAGTLVLGGLIISK